MSEQIRVLLVDDQDLFREGVRVIVDAQEGMGVVGTAGDGVEAVRLVDELTPDVVLMDIRMPEMDGVEATRQIFAPDRVARRKAAGAPPVRVVVLTTFNLDDRAATAIRHGASGFLLKDTTPVQLRDEKNTTILKTGAAGDKGETTFEGLAPGKYIVYATGVSDPYTKAQQAVTVEAGKTAAVTLSLTR